MSGRIEEFEKRDCQVLGVNTDFIETHVRWLTSPPTESGLGPIRFPLASDLEGIVCEKYGVYDRRQKMALRGLFLVDPNGVLQYQVTHNLNVGRSTDEVLRVLEAVQSGGLCPAERTAKDAIVLHDAIRPKQVLGNYEIKSELGNGAFGSVFLAHDTMLQRSVALKVLKNDDPNQVESLVKEARAAAALSHPNVCAIHSVDQSNGGDMIVMEFVEGESLQARLQSGKLSVDLAAKILFQIASAMALSHETGIVHGDLKPANVMLTSSDDVKIMDFGFAKQVSSTNWEQETIAKNWASIRTSSGSTGLSGTLGHMAPELTQGKAATHSSDVFALGLVAYEILTGRPAIQGDNLLDVIRCIDSIEGEVLAADAPEEFADIIRETLVKDVAERKISMADIADQLASVY